MWRIHPALQINIVLHSKRRVGDKTAIMALNQEILPMNAENTRKDAFFNVRHDILIFLLLVIATLIAYWQVMSHGFVSFDDPSYILNNRHVKDGLTLKGIRWAFSFTGISYWHPLTWLSHMLDCQLYGLTPGMHHSTNLILHIVNGLLLFQVLKLVTGALWRSAFVAALFLLHPLNVESVAWVAERKNVLSTFFWMTTMWAYVGYTHRPGCFRYLLVLLLFVLGLMAKPMLITLPFVLLLLDYWPLCRFKLPQIRRECNAQTGAFENSGFQGTTLLRLIGEKLPMIVFLPVSLYLSLASVTYVISMGLVPMKLRIANALISYPTYILKMIWPLHLSVFYPYPKAIPWWQAAGAGLLLICIFVPAFLAVRTRPYFTVGWLWYMGTLLPAIGLTQTGLWPAMADRFAYVPVIGLFFIISWGVNEILAGEGNKSLFLAIFAVTILSALTVCTRFQVSHWRNSIALFEHAVEVTGNNYVAYEKLGEAMDEQHMVAEAIRHYNKSLQINPDFWPTHLNIGVALRKEGKLHEALEHLYRVLSLKPDSVEAHIELGITLEAQGSLTQAVTHYFEALRIKPDFLKAHISLGNCMARQGNVKDAVYHYHEALRIDPAYAGAYINLGKIYKGQNNIKDAILYYRKALQYSPNMVQALYNLSLIYAGHEDEEFRNGRKAVELAEELCKITGYDQPFALDALAMAYAETGQFKKAVLTAQKALDLALSHSPEELVAGIEKRLQLFRRGHPYRQRIDEERRSQP